MFQHGGTDPDANDVQHLITVVVPHALVLLTTILNFFNSRRNSKEIKEVKRTLNGRVDK